MNKNDVIEMFRNGNTKQYIIDKVYSIEKVNNTKYTKLNAQEYVEMILCNWWKTVS